MMDFSEYIQKDFLYAVVGASADTRKYGNKVFKNLCRGGFRVIPVNPKLTDLAGVPAAANLQSVQPKPDVAVVIVPPEIGLKILDDAAAAGITKLWFQPGAESNAIRERAHELHLQIVADGSCIMVERRQLGYTEDTHDCRDHAENQATS